MIGHAMPVALRGSAFGLASQGDGERLIMLSRNFVMRGLDPRIHLLREKDGLPDQVRQ
jgi:hypothetical protein